MKKIVETTCEQRNNNRTQ